MNDCCVKYKPIYDDFIKLYPFASEDLDGEIWKAVPDYENYHVSNFGRVKSFKRKNPHIMKPAIGKRGYLCIDLCRAGTHRTFLVSRLVAITFIPNPQNLPMVDHVDTNHFNNHVSNLRWVTNAQNIKYSFENGRQAPAGEDHYKAKFTNEQIPYIRNNPDGLTQTQLAEMFCTSATVIGYVQLGKSYKNAGGVIREEIKRRLPAEDRSKIKGLHATGQYTQARLAEMFNCVQATIHNIIHE